MSVVNAWCGAPTSTGFRVAAKVTGASTRLAVSTTSSMDTPVFFGPVVPVDSFVQLEATGLDPQTRYWWAVEDDGVVDETYPGQVLTHPVVGSAASFQITVAGDAGLVPLTEGVAGSFRPDRISNHTIFDTIREKALTEGHLLFAHLGDTHYYNPGDPFLIAADLAGYRRCIDDVLLQPRQHELYRNVPIVHIWDDHDYGRNDSDSTNPGREIVWRVYREREPHYPLASETEGCHHAFQIGRVLFIAWDFRSFKTPKSTVDDSGKTALGASQKAWTRNLLETTSAEALVVLQQTVWTQAPTAGSDSWGGYNTERTELANMFTELGWADRMIMVGADAHTSAIDSGASNLWGGFPSGLFASLDAAPSDLTSGYDQYISNDYNQYGVISIEDDGSRIALTMTGYQESTVLGSWTVDIDTTPAPAPDPVPVAPPVIATAAIRNHVTWLGVHRSTGRIIAELPDVTGDPARRLSAYETARMSIPTTSGGLGHVPHELLDACTDGRSGALVAIVNDLPAWMGLPTLRTGGTASSLTVPCPTTEAYLLKRYVRDASFVDTDRAQVALALAQQAEAINGAGQGLGLEYDVENTGDLISIDYRTVERIKHYDAIRDLCVGGLEWEIAYDWADNSQTTIVKVLRIRRRIGRVDAPQAMFETSAAGSVIGYTLTESWAEGKYATHVTAVGSGQGEDQPASAPVIDQVAVDAGVPWVELVVSPGSNITEPDLLQAYAQAQAARVQGGTTSLTIDAQLDGYPRLGVDALLGDQVSYELESEWHPGPTVSSPNDHRLKGSRRMTSWVMHPAQGTWTPGLVEDPMLEA